MASLTRPFPGRTRGAQRDRIAAYYVQTTLDYRLLWLNSQNLAIHFGYYDEKVRRHADALSNMNRVLAAYAQIQPGQRVLDAGCGIGGSSFWLANHCAARVVGIALVPQQVERARGSAKARGLSDQVSFMCCDYTATPFAEGQFDVVWALESLCHAAEKAAFYREAARLLRPGGRVVAAEYMRTARPLTPEHERLLHSWLDGWAIPDLDTPAEHSAHAQDAGLQLLRLDDRTRQVRPSLQRLYRLAYWSHAGALVLHRLGARSGVQHGNVVGALQQFRALERGLWRYHLLAAAKPPT